MKRTPTFVARLAALLAAAYALSFVTPPALAQQGASRSGPHVAFTPLPTPAALEQGLQSPPPESSGTPAQTAPTVATGEQAPVADRGAANTRGGVPSQVLVLLGLGAIVLLGTVVVVLAVVLKKPIVIQVPSRSASTSGALYSPLGEEPAPSETPLEGTLRILPGRFMIEEGDKQVELRIFQTSGTDREETTIGRDPGPPYRHVQLRPASVSGRHAKLVYEAGVYTLVNFSRTNPTKVNGEELPEGASRRLVDEDRIEIGEVAMTYYEV